MEKSNRIKGFVGQPPRTAIIGCPVLVAVSA